VILGENAINIVIFSEKLYKKRHRNKRFTHITQELFDPPLNIEIGQQPEVPDYNTPYRPSRGVFAGGRRY